MAMDRTLATELVKCRRCTYRVFSASGFGHHVPRRSITQNHIRKTEEAKEQWRSQARFIRKGETKSMLSMLEERGYVHSIAGARNDLDHLMINKRIGAYAGFDPTAASLHVGHLLPLMTLFWLYIHGFHSVSLLGGATSRIGDPTDRLSTRPLDKSSVRKANMASMHLQLKKLWVNAERHARKYGYIREWAWRRGLVNNNEWLNKLSMVEFLSILGQHVRLGPMFGKETVRRKMEQGDGMSFAEFTYPLLQTWDWWHIYQTKGIQLQIGGSDQLGNIMAGIENIKQMAKNHPDLSIKRPQDGPDMAPVGFTTPLLTTASGEKFGKSAGNAIWLNQEMTSTFDYYQFFLRSADADVERYLKLFTFLPIPQIESIMEEHLQDPSQRKAQHVLARECAELVHGEEEAGKAELQHRAVFSRFTASTASPDSADTDETSASNRPVTATSAPSVNVTLPFSLVIGQPPARVLYSAGLVNSRSEGHKLAANQGAYIGSRPEGGGQMGDSLSFSPVKLWDSSKTQDYLLDGNLLVLRVGKWKVKVVRVISDEEFERSGFDAPGWNEEKARQKSISGD